MGSLFNVGDTKEQGELKPLLKWAGGKRWLVPYLRPIYAPHRHRRLVEPFCGGLAITLGLLPEKALLNDINPHLINFYRWVKKGLHIEIPLANDASMYYRHRDRFNELIRKGLADTNEAAQLFYYLNRTGYNGLCRFNQRGELNVPFGRYRQINYQRDFLRYAPIFEKWDFMYTDFANLPLDSADFVYADPPYDVPFRQYSEWGFSWEDQVRLAQWLAKHPGPVVLSNQATKRIVELYSDLGYKLYFLEAPRMISCTGDRRPAREVLALRNLLKSPCFPAASTGKRFENLP